MHIHILREVIEKHLRAAGCKEVVALVQFSGPVQKKNSLKVDVPLCTERTNLRGQEDSCLVATLAQDGVIVAARSITITYFCGALGLDIYLPSKEDRNVTV